MTKRKNPFPGVTRVEDRHGGIRFRYRSKGFTCYLPGPYGSVAFRAAYDDAVNGSKVSARGGSAQSGTFEWLIQNYIAGPRFKNLADSRRSSLRRELDWIRREIGDLPFARFAVRHVEALMGKKEGRPSAANAVKKNLSLLFNHAIRLELITHNPARLAERWKENPHGYHTWTDAEIDRFLAYHGKGTKARLAALLIMNTGAARKDLSRTGWQNVKGDRLIYNRSKTEVGGDYGIMPELAEELRNVPADQMLFFVHGRGKPYTVESFGSWFKDQCKAAGLPHCSIHGLRKGQATRMANEGSGELEIMAFLAHSTPKEGATYVKKASRAKLADMALSRVSGTKPEQDLSNHSQRLDKGGVQAIDIRGKK